MNSCKTCRSLFPRKKRSRSSPGQQICKRCCRRRLTDSGNDANQRMQGENNSLQELVSSSIYLVQDIKSLCWKSIRGMDAYFGVFMWREDLVLDSSSQMVTNDNYGRIQSQQPSTGLTQTNNGSDIVTRREVHQNINNIDGCSNKQCTRQQVVCILEYIRQHAGNVEFHSKSLISLIKIQQRYEDEGICRDSDILEVVNLITDELHLQWKNNRLKIQDIIKIYENLLQAKKFASKNNKCTYLLALENLIKQVIEAKFSFERQQIGSVRGTTVQQNTNTQASFVHQPMNSSREKSFTRTNSIIKNNHIIHNYNNHNQLHNYLYRNSCLSQSTQNSKFGAQFGFNSVCVSPQQQILYNGVGKRKFSGSVTNCVGNNSDSNNNNWSQNLVNGSKRVVIDLTLDDDDDDCSPNVGGQEKKQGTVVKQEVLHFDPLQMARRGG